MSESESESESELVGISVFLVVVVAAVVVVVIGHVLVVASPQTALFRKTFYFIFIFNYDYSMGSILVLFLLVDSCDRGPEMDYLGGGLGCSGGGGR